MLHSFWYGLLNFFGIRNESGPGYGFWSGFAGDLTILGGIVIYLRHNNCGHRWCPFPGHVMPNGQHRLCRLHRRRPLASLDLPQIHRDHL